MADPRSAAMRSASAASRRDDLSWYGVTGSAAQAVSAAASQNSSRPSQVSISLRVRRRGVQPGKAIGGVGDATASRGGTGGRCD